MSTVADLADLFDALLGQNADSFNTKRRLKLLAAAGHEAWKVLVGSKGDENWFLASSQSITPAAADYFPKLDTTTREYALPPNFHNFRGIEIVAPQGRNIRFEKTTIDDEAFESRRSNTAISNDIVFKYVIYGPAPGKLMLDAPSSEEIDLRLWYTATFTKWTALTDPTTEIPAVLDTLMAEWAVKRATLGLGESRWTAFEEYWQKQVVRTIQVYHRDSRGPVITQGIFEQE